MIAIDLDEGDSLSWVRRTDDNHKILVAMKKGMSIRFRETDVRAMGRAARGVRTITLKEGNCVTGLSTIHEGGLVLTVSETGYGRLSPVTDYHTWSRDGKGLLNYHVEKCGDVTSIKVVDPDDDMIIISSDGIVTRIYAVSVRVYARPNKDVYVMRVDGVENRVVTLTRTPRDDEEETNDSLIEDDGSAESAEDLVEEGVLDEAAPENKGVPEEE